MVNRVHKYGDRDIKRVIKAARAAGLAVSSITVDPRTGTITAAEGQSGASTRTVNPWDEVLNRAEDAKRPA